jgi:DNA-binding transcriptional ArsR family regulator
MSNELLIESMSNKIENAFKSLMKSGRPDILNHEYESIIDQIYVDLFDRNYALNQVLDNNHLIIEGRRGTGKSTIFLKAEEMLIKQEKSIPIYINLQTIIEQLPKEISDNGYSDFSYYLTYKNFMISILDRIGSEVSKKNKGFKASEIQNLFDDVKEGILYNSEFDNSIELTSKIKKSNNASLKGSVNPISAVLKGKYSQENIEENIRKETKNEKRVFSINDVLNKLVKLLKKGKGFKVYLLLDDFSELDKSAQAMVIDNLVSPIISSYNSNFVVKIAAYPGRIYRGALDSTKLPSLNLDFYDAFERNSADSKYTNIEKYAIEYIDRTLRRRIKVFTDRQLELEDIFDLSKADLKEYLKTIFHATACIPRAMGFILNYCYLNSINRGSKITMRHLDNAAMKYFEDNILEDFQNDIRFKQSFHDDKDILDHFAQINLKNKLVEKAKVIKVDAISEYKKGDQKKIFRKTLDVKKNNAYYFPTSHFFINTEKESLLQTLELYFIVSKFNEGSSKNSSSKESFYALNYGLCKTQNIDFGKPENRRDSYDYWRQIEFDYNSFIPKTLSSVEEIVCIECGKVYPEIQYEIYLQNKNCFKCTKEDTVKKINKFEAKLKDKIGEWSNKALPDSHIEILRTLFNNQGKELSAYEISLVIDKHHLTVTNASKTLKGKGLLDYRVIDKRYYSITEDAISKFFTSDINI